MNSEDILVNIITRTHNRPDYFKVCRESILNQTHKNINHIVGSDVECDYCDDYIKLSLQKTVSPKPDGPATYEAPWNLHCNELGKYVKDGWVMYLDDDDKFIFPDSLKIIINFITDEDQMILWRVDINGNICPNDECFGKIVPGNISSIGFMFHSKYLPVDWGSWNYGDYRVTTELSKKISQRWINTVLTQTQGKPNFGGTPDPITIKNDLSMFGGWAIDVECYKKILEILPPGKTILEFGSGRATDKLAETYSMFSVENDKKWVDKYNSTYIFSPIVKNNDEPKINWYDPKVLKNNLPEHYDLILVDGPVGALTPNGMTRDGFRRNKHLFNLDDVIIVFDDIHRKAEMDSMNMLAKELNRKVEIFNGGLDKKEPKKFGVIYPHK